MRISDWSSDVCSSDLVDEASFRSRNVEPYLHVRKDEGRVRESARIPVSQDFPISVGHVVVGDSNRLDDGRRLFKRREIVVPCVRPAELIVHDGTRRLHLSLPPPPLRPPLHPTPPHPFPPPPSPPPHPP